MSMRGVFFVLFFLLLCISAGEAYDVRGGIQGSLGSEGVEHELSLDAKQQWSGLKIDAGWKGQWLSSSAETKHYLNWQMCFDAKHLQLIFSGNKPHYTSGALFRLVHKDNFGPDSSSFLIVSEGLKLGLLRRIPLRSLDQVDVWFYESALDLGPFSLKGMQLQYSGFKEAGAAQVLHGEGSWRDWKVLVGRGWQTNSSGVESRARLAEIRNNGDFWEVLLTYQSIDPQFSSLLAKTNKHTPDRRGWRVEAVYNSATWRLKFNRRQHSNIEGSKKCNQLSWQFSSHDKKSSMQLRLEPTPAFILRAVGEGVVAQFDAWNGAMRVDWHRDQLRYGFRWDVERGIIRFELGHQLPFEWRIIAKFDVAQRRQHYSLLASYATKTAELKLEIGSYDRGNLLAGFNNPPSYRISWGWKF